MAFFRRSLIENGQNWEYILVLRFFDFQPWIFEAVIKSYGS